MTDMFIKSFLYNIEKQSVLLMPLILAEAATGVARHVKSPLYRKAYSGLDDAEDLSNKKLDEIESKYKIPKGWTMRFGDDIGDEDTLMDSFIPKIVQKSAPSVLRNKVNTFMVSEMKKRDWTDPVTKTIHVNTICPDLIYHEIGHADDYDRNPKMATLKALRFPEIFPFVTLGMALGLTAVSRRMKNPSEFLKLIGRNPEMMTAIGVAPILYRESVASVNALKHLDKNETSKNLIPLMGSYAAYSSIPVMAANIAKRFIR